MKKILPVWLIQKSLYMCASVSGASGWCAWLVVAGQLRAGC